jgi:hypothetical protein
MQSAAGCASECSRETHLLAGAAVVLALGYAAVFAVAVGLLSARYLQELNHPADVATSGGRYGGGGLLLGCAAHPWVNVHG